MTDTTKVVFILGAEDPEMASIRKLVTEAGCVAVDAVDGEGKRVNPRTSYQADPMGWPSDAILVECAPADGVPPGMTVIDHHDPHIHPAARLGAADYWQAASIGQVFRLLAERGLVEQTPSDELMLVAAMDHRLPPAYAGKCPGIDPAAVFERDLINVSRAPGGREDPEYVRSLIDAASQAIRACPVIEMAGQSVYDGRALPPTPSGYSAESLAITKATCRDGVALLALFSDNDGRRKVTIGGACAPETVDHFMSVFAPSLGLTGIYGVPARGYAGGYLTDSSIPA